MFVVYPDPIIVDGGPSVLTHLPNVARGYPNPATHSAIKARTNIRSRHKHWASAATAAAAAASDQRSSQYAATSNLLFALDHPPLLQQCPRRRHSPKTTRTESSPPSANPRTRFISLRSVVYTTPILTQTSGHTPDCREPWPSSTIIQGMRRISG